MKPQEQIQEVWDIKKIIIGIIGIVAVGAGGFGAFIYAKNHEIMTKSLFEVSTNKNVMGTSTQQKGNPTPKAQSSFSFPTSKEQVRDQLENISKQVSYLSVSEIASSSPQVRKILEDLKALEEFPHNQVKEMCQKICSSF